MKFFPEANVYVLNYAGHKKQGVGVSRTPAVPWGQCQWTSVSCALYCNAPPLSGFCLFVYLKDKHGTKCVESKVWSHMHVYWRLE